MTIDFIYLHLKKQISVFSYNLGKLRLNLLLLRTVHFKKINNLTCNFTYFLVSAAISHNFFDYPRNIISSTFLFLFEDFNNATDVTVLLITFEIASFMKLYLDKNDTYPYAKRFGISFIFYAIPNPLDPLLEERVLVCATANLYAIAWFKALRIFDAAIGVTVWPVPLKLVHMGEKSARNLGSTVIYNMKTRMISTWYFSIGSGDSVAFFGYVFSLDYIDCHRLLGLSHEWKLEYKRPSAN